MFHPEEHLATIRQGGCRLAYTLAEPRQVCVEVAISERVQGDMHCLLVSAPNPGNWKKVKRSYRLDA